MLDASREPLEAFLEIFGKLLGRSWVSLGSLSGASWAAWRSPGSLLDPLGGLLELLGSLLGRLQGLAGAFSVILEARRTILGALGAILEATWGVCLLGDFWEALGTILDGRGD